MKDIKFRAWDKEYRQMQYVGQMHFSHPRGTTPNVLEYICLDKHDTLYYADKFILMQFIGLKDKNGVEAYHKDICSGKWPYSDKCIIEWDNKRCGFYLKPIGGTNFCAYDKGYKLNANKFEIIGNVHENPDLLGAT